MVKSKKTASSVLFERIRGEIPNAEKLVQLAIETKLGQRDDAEDFIRKNFSSLIEELQVDSYNLYLESEKHSASGIIRKSVAERLPPGGSAENALDIMAASFGELDKFFLSLRQNRRSFQRNTFELIVPTLLSKVGYPVVRQPVLSANLTDYILPNKELFETSIVDCLLVVVGRELENVLDNEMFLRRGRPQVFVMTGHEFIQDSTISKLGKLNIKLVVSRRVKDQYQAPSHIILNFEHFLEHYVDPALARWKAQGVLH